MNTTTDKERNEANRRHGLPCWCGHSPSKHEPYSGKEVCDGTYSDGDPCGCDEYVGNEELYLP